MSKGVSIAIYVAVFAAALAGFIKFGSWNTGEPESTTAVGETEPPNNDAGEHRFTPSPAARLNESNSIQEDSEPDMTGMDNSLPMEGARSYEVQPAVVPAGGSGEVGGFTGIPANAQEGIEPDVAGIDNPPAEVPPRHDLQPVVEESDAGAAGAGTGFTDTPEETAAQRSERVQRAVNSPGVSVPSLSETYGDPSRSVHPDAINEYYDTPPEWINPDPERAETHETRANRLGESLKQLRE